ncbi:MAG: MerR family DNA-binding transcriptional regulator [Burkholderiaceae bacterium]|jgi:DNA-binding transcriptional MerR regulator
MATYSITELAREFDVTPRAIRFYEDQGLLEPSREGVNGRQRVYSQRDRTRLKLTLRGKRLGLALSEIKELVDMYESPKDTVAQLSRFLAVLARHRQTLEQQREDIEVALAEVETHESQCRKLLADTGIRPLPLGDAMRATTKAPRRGTKAAPER